MNSCVFEKHSGNIPKKKCSADRFVPRRSGVDLKSLKSKILYERKIGEKNADDIFVEHPQSWRLKGYRRLLSSTCGISGSTPQPLLKVTEGSGMSANVAPQSPSNWACWPRKKPVILQPDVIFDLPGYEEFMEFDVLDWGKRDFFIAGLSDQIFMLESATNNVTKLYTLDDTQDSVFVVKWDPFGTHIAIGTENGNLHIYDSNLGLMMRLPSMWYQIPEEEHTPITALTWHPKGFLLACCTGLGSLCICDTRVKKPPEISRKAHEGGIVKCSFSPNGEYLVTSGTDGNVRIWRLPDLKPFFQIVYAHTAKSLAWHPWRSCQLAVGGGLGPQHGHGDGSLSVWDVSLQVNLCHQLPTIPCAVDSLAWSQLTGELVVSYWVKGRQPGSDEQADGHSRVLVLSAPGNATDEMSSPSGRTKVLLFNPDGTKIATASTDENLFIWNFLGPEGPLSKNHKRKIKRNNGAFRLSEINEYNNFGYTIR